MSKKEERIKVLKEYLDELSEKLSQFLEKAKKRREELSKELNDISLEGEKLFDEINLVKELYDKLSNPDHKADELSKDSIFAAMQGPITITDAIELIFAQAPTKEFEPTKLKDELEIIQKAGLLKTRSGNLLWSVHSSLKKLLNDGIIEKNNSGNKSTYHKKKKFEFELPPNIAELLKGRINRPVQKT